jgi:hypothetical protein
MDRTARTAKRSTQIDESWEQTVRSPLDNNRVAHKMNHRVMGWISDISHILCDSYVKKIASIVEERLEHEVKFPDFTGVDLLLNACSRR